MAPRKRKGPRLFVDGLSKRGALEPNSSLLLSPSDSHYLKDVLRLPVGAWIELGDPATPGIFEAQITGIAESVTLLIAERVSEDAPALATSLLFALCKGQKNELVCDWATELGCSEIIFWQAERSIVRLRSRDDATTKEARLAKIATAAAQQSRQARPPRVLVACSLAEALQKMTLATLKVCCSLEHDATPMSELFKDLQPQAHIAIVIGPEGDLTPGELETLKGQGFTSVSLGPNVLRSELAAVTALTSLRVGLKT